MNWRDIPSLSALRAFEAAVRCASLSAAARELNVTHAAIAQHVRTLESRFGTALLRREGRTMVPTDQGRQLAQSLGDGFATIADGVRALDRQAAARPLRVTLTPAFAANWLMPRIGGFWAAHPEIRLELLPDPALVDMRAVAVDVAIRYGRGGWPGVDVEVLVTARHTIVAAPSLADCIDISDPSQLMAQHWLMETGRSEERLWAGSLGIAFDTVRMTEFESSALALQAVIAGHGVSIVPEAIAAGEVAQGRLCILHSERDSDLAYHILTRPGHGGKAQTIFVNWLHSAV